MDTSIACTPKKVSFKGRGAATEITGIIRKIVKALTFNADAIFKSKDWPYLWQK
jgi:hypothetical protein